MQFTTPEAVESSPEQERKEKRRIINLNYRSRNKEKLRLYKKEWWAKTYPLKRDEILEKNRIYLSKPENAEKVKAQQKKYRLKNLDKIKEKSRRWEESHKDNPQYRLHRAAIGRKSYQKNKEKVLAGHKIWRKNNKAAYRALMQKRRALEKGATINLTEIKNWFKLVRSKSTFICYYCQEKFPIKRVHFDHIVALKNGGEHSIRNLCASCDKCNLTKGSKPILLWIKIGQQVLPL